jgi:RNA polymerase sigma factor (sigma-70 family)
LRWRWWREFRDRRRAEPHPQPSQLDRDETNQKVRDAVAALPPRDREVIVLFYLENQSISAIAGLLGSSNNAVEVRLHRARQKLKGALDGLLGD